MSNSFDENRRKIAGVRWRWFAGDNAPVDIELTLIAFGDGYRIGDGASEFSRTWNLQAADAGFVLTVWGDHGGPTFHVRWNGSRFEGIWDDKQIPVRLEPLQPIDLAEVSLSVATVDPVPFYVGIPTLHCYDLCKLAVDAVLASSLLPETIFVIDNGDQRVGFNHPHPLVSVVRARRNLGVAQSWNLLHKLARPQPLILLNDDITIGRNCLEKLITTDAPFATLRQAHAYEAFMLREEIWRDIGEFDETFWPAYHEDNDHARRMMLAGFRMAYPENDGVVQNGPSATVKRMSHEQRIKFNASFDACRDYYRAKWGGLPHQETHLTPFNK